MPTKSIPVPNVLGYKYYSSAIPAYDRLGNLLPSCHTYRHPDGSIMTIPVS